MAGLVKDKSLRILMTQQLLCDESSGSVGLIV